MQSFLRLFDFIWSKIKTHLWLSGPPEIREKTYLGVEKIQKTMNTERKEAGMACLDTESEKVQLLERLCKFNAIIKKNFERFSVSS